MPRISYVDPSSIDDPELQHVFEVAATRGTPRPESQAVRAHVPEILRTFFATWEAVISDGALDAATKELCRLYVSRTVECNYCGDQRGAAFGMAGATEDDVDELVRYATSDHFDDRQKAALAYAEAITWNPAKADDVLWAELHRHFSDAQLVELGYFVALTSGQQRWIRTMDLRHGEVLGDQLTGVVGASAAAGE